MPKPVDPLPLPPPSRDPLVRVTTCVIALLLVVLATSQLLIARRTETSAVAASVQRRHDPRRSQRGTDRERMAHEPLEPSANAATTFVSWKTLRSLDIESGIAFPPLDRLHRQRIRVVGFVIPVDDLAFETAEFLFVPYAGACVHSPVPAVNQMILVRMRNNRPIPVAWGEPVEVDGVLHIEATESVYATSAFRLDGLSARLALTDD